ncbi:zf-CCHC domain-containing protein [Tanacetum coccineum]|uniref:Zf-CCHC domain-containing protein n=1 Tax=Tanacetum coccineum TaxID=301880 RepID=A0ABQ5DRG2_9ASTR
MQRLPLFESGHFMYWKNRFETYVKTKDLDLWHIILNGDFPTVARNKETQILEIVPFEQQDDDLKKKLAKNNEAKMVLYNALPKKEYERIFMCKTAKDIWQSLLITHQEESINSGFARFNTIITSFKALDEGFSSKNYVRKFLRVLHPKWRAKITAIKESKDLSSLALDELIDNLNVHEVVMEKDFEYYRGKKERIKSIALKAKKEYSDDETSTIPKSKSYRQEGDEKVRVKSDRKCFRCGDPNHLIGDCPKPSRNKDQKAFIGGSWSDSEYDAKDKTNDETCLMAQSSNENTMAELNVPAQAPTRTDEQIVPRSQWLQIGKSNLLFDAQKIQKNPIFQISVDILRNTNFFRAFSASASVPAVYIQQFWNSMKYDEKTGVYSCQVDEQWFNLSADLLRKALDITPVDPAHPFELPLTGDTVIDFVNQLGTNDVHKRPESPCHLPGDDFLLGNLKFISKGETNEVFGMTIPKQLITQAIQQSLYYPKYLEMVAKNTKKTPQDSASKQPEPATKGAPPKKPTTTTLVKPTKSPSSKHPKSLTKKPSKRKLLQKVRKGKPSFQLLDEDDEAQQEFVPQEEGVDPDLELAKKMSLDAHQEKGKESETEVAAPKGDKELGEVDSSTVSSGVSIPVSTQGQARSDPEKAHEALAGPDPKPMQEDQTGSNSGKLRVARLEQEMSEVKKTDHSADVLASIKSQVLRYKDVKDRDKKPQKKHDSDGDEGPSAGSNQGKSAKRRRHDSGASGSAQPPTKDDEQSSKETRESDASTSKQHPLLLN